MRRDSPVDCRPTGIIINCIYSSIHCIIPCRFRVNRNNNNRNRRTLVGGPPRLPHSPSVLHGLQRQLGESEGEDVTLLIHLNCKTSPPSIFHTFHENPLPSLFWCPFAGGAHTGRGTGAELINKSRGRENCILLHRPHLTGPVRQPDVSHVVDGDLHLMPWRFQISR